ncbi:MAG: DUF502 domain-containing protein [Candidatus Omnitrophota bacterium]|nr:MAG: DUF502 domain-containing protein [Candidatus Omnitrophota bacterium]
MKIKSKLHNYFIAGIVVVLPILLTVNVLVITVRVLDNLFGRFIYPYFEKIFGVSFFGLGLFSVIILIFITGMLTANVFMKKLMPFLENWFVRVPFVAQVYPSIKQLVNFLFSKEKMAFKKVVIFEYPKKNIYTMGFVTNELSLKSTDGTQLDALSIYISSAPNPITGFFIIVPKKDVTFLDIPIEDAFKYIVSGGVLMPDSLNTGNLKFSEQSSADLSRD